MKALKLVSLSIGLLLTVTSNAQNCNTNIIPSTPNSNFTDNADGTVTDNTTGLMWMRCSLGQGWDGSACTGTANTYDWQNALSSAESNTFANQDDWYLPNVKELITIVEVACDGPAVNETIFSILSDLYWTSSPVSGVTFRAYAWQTNFIKGGNAYSQKRTGYNVILVRKP